MTVSVLRQEKAAEAEVGSRSLRLPSYRAAARPGRRQERERERSFENQCRHSGATAESRDERGWTVVT